jgi:hypothetical protein
LPGASAGGRTRKRPCRTDVRVGSNATGSSRRQVRPCRLFPDHDRFFRCLQFRDVPFAIGSSRHLAGRARLAPESGSIFRALVAPRLKRTITTSGRDQELPSSPSPHQFGRLIWTRSAGSDASIWARSASCALPHPIAAWVLTFAAPGLRDFRIRTRFRSQ